MPTAKDYAAVERLYQETGQRIRLRPWETVESFAMSDTSLALVIDTFEVRVLVREDRYEKHGSRMIMYRRVANRWRLVFDELRWDDEFVPYVYEKVGRRKTAEEHIEQREWEKMCHRPGTSRTPLDSYERVLGGSYFDSEKKMERHF